MRDAQEFAQAVMATAQQRSEENANRLRRQPERFKVGDKVWLNLLHVKTPPQLSKKLAWQHTKYEVTAVPDALNVELNVPGNIHKRFHVELIKRVGTDPFPSQRRDDVRNPPAVDELGNDEFKVESILRARTVRREHGLFRQASVKWISEADPSWEPVENLDTATLDKFEKLYEPIAINDGPDKATVGSHVGPTEKHIVKKRRRRKFKSRSQGEEGEL